VTLQKTLIMLLRQAKGVLEDTWETQCAVLTAQIGDYAKCVQYARVHSQDVEAYKAEAAKAIGDLLIQCSITCELLGVDYEQVYFNAYAAFRDRMKEIAQKRREKPSTSTP